MALYVVESSSFGLVEDGLRSKQGALGVGGVSEKVYLHVLELDPSKLTKLVARVDEDGNKQHDRLTTPGNEDWWFAVEAEKVWPGTVRPKVASRCTWAEDGSPVPKPLDDEELGELRRVGALK